MDYSTELLDHLMEAIYTQLKPMLDASMISLSNVKKEQDAIANSPKSIVASTNYAHVLFIQNLQTHRSRLNTLNSALAIFLSTGDPTTALCLSKMSAFILLPAAASLQTLTAHLPPPNGPQEPVTAHLHALLELSGESCTHDSNARHTLCKHTHAPTSSVALVHTPQPRSLQATSRFSPTATSRTPPTPRPPTSSL